MVHIVGSLGNSCGSNLGGAAAEVIKDASKMALSILFIVDGAWTDSNFSIGPGWTTTLFSGLEGSVRIQKKAIINRPLLILKSLEMWLAYL